MNSPPGTHRPDFPRHPDKINVRIMSESAAARKPANTKKYICITFIQCWSNVEGLSIHLQGQLFRDARSIKVSSLANPAYR